MVRENGTPDPETATTPAGYISLADLDAILEERDRKHAEALASVKQLLPVAMVPANSGGPGIDNHQRSWSKAEQEAAQRGEVLDTWT